MPLSLVPPRKGRSPNWRIRGTVRGLYIDETTGVATKELAEAVRIKREGELLDRSIFGQRASRGFSAAALAYIEARKVRGSQLVAIIGRERKDRSISPSLVSDFGSTLVSAIDQARVDDVLAGARFRNWKPGTIQRQFLTPLIAILRFSAKRKWCDLPALERPRFKDARDRWATYDEADRLLAGASRHLRPLLLFLMLTGARLSEALELDWTDIDLVAHWLVFRDTKRNKGPMEEGEDRGVPLHPQLVVVLANLPGEKKGRVFRTQRGKPYTAHRDEGGGQISTAWSTACRRAKIANMTPHDLRHTFATWLLMAGVPGRIRDELMGHATSDTGSRYAHVPRDEAIQAIDKLPNRGAGVDFQPRRVAETKAAVRMRQLREARRAAG